MKKLFIALLLLVAVLGMSSCDLLGGLFYPYIGTWVYENTASDSKVILTLEKEAFEVIIQMQDSDEWVDYMAQKGTVTVEQDTMIITVTHVKMVDIDYSTGEISALPEEWTEADGLVAAPSIGTWAVDGDELTLTDDDGNITVYTKQ